MKNLLKFALLSYILLVLGCSWFQEGEDYPDKPSSEPPELIRADGDRWYYTPHVSPKNEYGIAVRPNETEVCEIQQLNIRTETHQVQSNLATFIFATVETNGTVDLNEHLTEFQLQLLNNTKHLHLKSVTLHSVAGADFDFLSWFEGYATKQKDVMITWGGPFPSDKTSLPLSTDGTIDLMLYFDNGKFDYKNIFRATAPSVTTYVAADLEFIQYYNCVIQ